MFVIWTRRCSLAEMFEYGVSLGASHHRRQCRRVRLSNGLNAAEVLEQASRGAGAHPGNVLQLRGAIADLAAFAMESHGEAVGFVTNRLHQVQHRRVMVENDRLIFL